MNSFISNSKKHTITNTKYIKNTLKMSNIRLAKLKNSGGGIHNNESSKLKCREKEVQDCKFFIYRLLINKSLFHQKYAFGKQ